MNNDCAPTANSSLVLVLLLGDGFYRIGRESFSSRRWFPLGRAAVLETRRAFFLFELLQNDIELLHIYVLTLDVVFDGELTPTMSIAAFWSLYLFFMCLKFKEMFFFFFLREEKCRFLVQYVWERFKLTTFSFGQRYILITIRTIFALIKEMSFT